MIKKFFSSGKLTGTLLLITALFLAFATFYENYVSSSELAKEYFYNSYFLFALFFLLCVNFLFISSNYIKAKRYGMVVLHTAFVVILLGALVTHIFGKEGILYLREGETSSQLLNKNNQPVSRLPFEVTLDRFLLERYSESGSPSSFESYIKISGREYHIYMNNMVKYRGYRFYQSNYDSDLKGSILSVNYDPWGITITYIGYILLLVGFIWAMLEKKSRLRFLLKKISIILILIFPCITNAQSVKDDAFIYSIKYAPADSIAEKFGRLVIQTSEGRLEPIDTYSREILVKISKSTTFNGLSSNQVLLGLCTQQPIWSYVPFVKIPNDTICTLLSLPIKTDMASYSDAFDADGKYVLSNLVDSIYNINPRERNATDKDIIKFDERLNIISLLMSGKILSIFPKDGSRQWYSPSDDLSSFDHMDSVFVSHSMLYIASKLNIDETDNEKAAEIIDMIKLYQQKKGVLNNISERKINAEILYNKLNAVRITGYGYMFFGLLFVIISVLSILRGKNVTTISTGIYGIFILLFLFLTFSLLLRWYISGNAPWSNAYESVVYVGWATALIGLSMKNRSKIILALSSFFAGAILFVSNLSFMDPQITPLVPVLKSYWLVIHVATITASYGFFGVSFLIGLTTILILAIHPRGFEKDIERLTLSNELLMWIGLALMTIGTFLGAVWANQSWGRYWGWDPKETWALITIIIYALVLHVRFIFNQKNNLIFAILSVFALGTVLMTFFGVNYYLSGLHSYAGGTSPIGFKIIWISYIMISIFSFVALVRNKTTL